MSEYPETVYRFLRLVKADCDTWGQERCKRGLHAKFPWPALAVPPELTRAARISHRRRLVVCHGERPVANERCSVVGAGFAVGEFPRYSLTPEGEAVLDLWDEPPDKPTADLPVDWTDYRNGPGGEWLTAEFCLERYGVTYKNLQAHPTAFEYRRRHPEGRGFVYRQADVASISNRKPDA